MLQRKGVQVFEAPLSRYMEMYCDMRYAIECTRKLSVRKRIWKTISVSNIGDGRLSTLQTKIKGTEQNLKGLVDITQNIHSKERAEEILLRIEQISALVEAIAQSLELSKIHIAVKAVNGTWNDENEEPLLEGTRQELLEDIVKWADNPDGEQFFWLDGMAGTGKSTISRKMASLFQDRGILGASFFFKRGQLDCDSANKVIPTIAYQLMNLFPRLKKEIQEVIKKDALIFEQTLEAQFTALLLGPLKQLEISGHQRLTMVLILDAMDECSNQYPVDAVPKLLLLLSQLKGVKVLDMRFLVIGRPEAPISDGFDRLDESKYFKVSLEQVESVKDDISNFLRTKLNKRKAHCMRVNLHGRNLFEIPETWPEESLIEVSTESACPLLIAASTMTRFIGASKFSPVERANIFLQNEGSRSNTFEVYRTVLDQFVSVDDLTDKRQILEDFHRIVGPIILLYNPLATNALSRLLGIDQSLIDRRLRDLRSVLVVPDQEDVPIRLLHLSFRDVLFDDKTSQMGQFKVDAKAQNHNLAMRCIDVMSDKKGGLRRNSFCFEHKPVDHECSKVNDDKGKLEPHVSYACQYWVEHLQNCPDTFDHDLVYAFFADHFLHWLEVMALFDMTSEALRHLVELEKILSASVRDPKDTLSERLILTIYSENAKLSADKISS
ncbi:uncharacterized protein N7483_010159 [Penicillium malachiteum]|uniref:uncharacterized protein n=1 Tax=Penicillium malachiteum TaxID=1324776 RepID=UPI002547A614|nr:uncharacterized protein N7483_010159 [Penicillium malachiteum]KAJ5712978.1 hypothetical protein N7483_010159 [Penicillium malachiteum]